MTEMNHNSRHGDGEIEKMLHLHIPAGRSSMTDILGRDDKPRLRSHKVIPEEKSELAVNRIVEDFKFKDNEHQQDFKSPKKTGTSCVVQRENKKVMAPRPADELSKTAEEGDTDQQLTTNVAVEILDQLNEEYLVDGKNFANFEIRVNPFEQSMSPDPSPVPATESPMGVEAPPNASPFLSDSLFDMVGLLSSTGNRSAVVNPMQCLYPSDGGFNGDNEMSDVECQTNTMTLGDAKRSSVKDPDSPMELTGSDDVKEVPREKLVLNETVYGTPKALEELAMNHDNLLLKTGNHCVYTDQRLKVLRDSSTYHEELLGQGSFGIVHKCTSNGVVFVRKKVKKECFHPSEVIFTSNTTHPSIVKSSGFRVREQVPEIYMEFAGQSLLSLVHTEKTLPERTIWTLTWDLCRGLEFLDLKNVVHFDIKPENMFVMKDESGDNRLKIGDFGSARMPGDPTKMSDWTPEYCAPEMGQLFLKKQCPQGFPQSEQEIDGSLQPKTDVFSAGLVVGFMYTGDHVLHQFIRQTMPHIPREQYRVLALVEVSRRQDVDQLLMPEAAESQMREVLQGMLQFNVENRSSATQTIELMEALSTLTKDSCPSKKNRTVEEKLPSTQRQDMKKQPVRAKAGRKRVRKKKETVIEKAVPQAESEKAVEILSQNPQLKRRLVRDELKRKLQSRPDTAETSGKVMRLVEAEQGELEDSQERLIRDGNQTDFSVEGNQNSLSMKGNQPRFSTEGEQYMAIMSGNQPGFSTEGNQYKSVMNGNQIGALGAENQVTLPGTGSQFEFVDLNQKGIFPPVYQEGLSEFLIPLEPQFQEIQVSENHSLVCQAQDDWSVQESMPVDDWSVQEATPVEDSAPGNLPDLGSLGF